MNWGLLGSIVLAAVVAWHVAAPLWACEGGGAVSGDDPAEGLADQKARCLQVLRDLELDCTTGKVSPADYEQTKMRLGVELAAILERIDALTRR
jgi:hypothetical protein